MIQSLHKAKNRVIIVCPWLNKSSLDTNMMEEFQMALERNVKIEIGWGWRQDIGTVIIPRKGYWSFQPCNTWKYDAMSKLQNLRKLYPKQFHLKLMGTHSKLWICDNQFAVVSSANILCSKPNHDEQVHEETGLCTTDHKDIQDLIICFEKAPNLVA